MRFRFDAGTIVLEGDDADDLARKLPGMRRDERVGAHRAPDYLWPRIREALVRHTGRVPDGVRPIGRVLDGWSAVELRPYQESALLAWQLSGQRGLVALPTGSGKTKVALAAMARTGLSTLCLVPTRVLLDQWRRAIAEVRAGPVGQLGDGVRAIERITVTTFESAYRSMHRIGNRFDLLVIDEAHHFGSGVRDEALEMSTRRHGWGSPPLHLRTKRRSRGFATSSVRSCTSSRSAICPAASSHRTTSSRSAST